MIDLSTALPISAKALLSIPFDTAKVLPGEYTILYAMAFTRLKKCKNQQGKRHHNQANLTRPVGGISFHFTIPSHVIKRDREA